MTGFRSKKNIVLLNKFPPICPHCWNVAYELTDVGIEWRPNQEAFNIYICGMCLGKTGVADKKLEVN